MSKLLRVQSIKKPNEIKHKEGEDPKVMYDKIEALRGNYPDQAKTLDNDKIVTHLSLVCAKLGKQKLMQAQVEVEVNNTEIMLKSLIRHMNVACKIKSSGEGEAQVGECKVALTNTEFKGKCHTCGNYWHKQNNVPRKISQKKKKETKSLSESAISEVR